MIRKIKISGFKLIADAELDLGKLNVFVGANGAGKSAILEAIGYAGAASSGAVLHETVHARGLRFGDPGHVVCALDGPIQVQTLQLYVENDRASYIVELGGNRAADGAPWQFVHEAIWADGTQWLDRDADRVKIPEGIAAAEPEFASPPPAEGIGPGMRSWLPPEPVPALFNSLRDYRVYAFSTPVMRRQATDPWSREPYLGLGGSFLSQALSGLADPAMRGAILDCLCDLIGWVDDVYGKGEAYPSPSTTGNGQVFNRDSHDVRFKDRYMREPHNVVSATEASEGALHVLATLVALLHPDTPKFFAIDNLDTALNPRVVMVLVRYVQQMLKKEATGRQLLVTVHNPSALDGLDLRDPDLRLFTVSRRTDGATSIHRVRLDDIDPSQYSRSLSSLWLSGVLGGMPPVW